MSDVKIYILTHKKFDYDENNLYEPILNGSTFSDDDFGYTRDDSGDNISNLHPYYAELSGQYWAWKNSNVDIVGFCHYRRYFVKNLRFKRLEKNEIEEILKDYDIILPKKRYLNMTNIEEINRGHQDFGICQTVEDYELIRKIIQNQSPEYLESFDEVLNAKEAYWYNMYICKKEIFDDYFSWAFSILESFRKQTDFTEYSTENRRVLAYISERLINVYVKKHDLKVKEEYVHNTEARIPIIPLIEVYSPFLQTAVGKIIKFERNLKK